MIQAFFEYVELDFEHRDQYANAFQNLRDDKLQGIILKKSVKNGIIPRSPQPTGDTDDLATKIRSPRG